MLPRELETILSAVSLSDYFATAFSCGEGSPGAAESGPAVPARAAGAAQCGCK